MISFSDATDAELAIMREAIDALAQTRPTLIHEDETASHLVHAVMNEIVARRNWRLRRRHTHDRGAV